MEPRGLVNTFGRLQLLFITDTSQVTTANALILATSGTIPYHILLETTTFVSLAILISIMVAYTQLIHYGMVKDARLLARVVPLIDLHGFVPLFPKLLQKTWRYEYVLTKELGMKM